jgi:hypothetical protein
MKTLLTSLLLVLAACWQPQAQAQERILAYDSEVQVNANGSLDVTERIRVRAEGSQIRRGIYRDFPTRYRDRHGNRVVVGFEMREVLRDGRTEPWFTEKLGNGVRINTGNDDFLPVPADYTYTLRYRTTRQLGFFAGHDELYWNAIGTGWAFPIESGQVDVRLPQTVPEARLHAEGYTGPQGAQAQDYQARIIAPGAAQWRLTQPLAAGEGMTIVLTFPKGVVAAPTRAQRVWWLLKDNRGVLIALAALVALLVFCLRRWHALGRDPRAGIVIARYDPPQGYSPAALRFIQRMGHDPRCLSSDLLELAVKGVLRIERSKRLLSDSWKLVRTSSEGEPLPKSERALLSLFGGGEEIELTKTNATRLQAAGQAQAAALKQDYDGRMFRHNGKSIAMAALIAVAGFALAMLLGGGGGVLLIFLVGALMVATLIVFAILVRAPTAEGRKLMDEIAGLKLYLSVAEQDELARLPGPDAPPVLNAKRYQQLLPYAVALEVEEAWTRKFTLAVGAASAAAAMAGMAWYRGGGADSLDSLTRSIGSAFTSQIASSSTPPGSSSGSGGGGSSGGGGGGGGGGGR